MKNTLSPSNGHYTFNKEKFKKVIDGKNVDLFVLENKHGMQVAVTNYGCTITAIMVPDKENNFDNIILSYDSLDDLIHGPEPFLSTTIGRYGNRIAKGKFYLNNKGYNLATNNGPNHLHGGPTGFHTKVWDYHQVSDQKIVFTYKSKDGEEGFPGNLKIEMIYELLNDSNSITFEYKATTDAPTLVNLTNHGFFNLAGTANPTPSIEDNKVLINANYYIPIDETSIPTGEIHKVENTPFDFRIPYNIGDRINDKHEQLIRGAGYDHCFVLNKKERNELSFAASCFDPKSGRKMDVFTTELGVQLYTGNWLGGFTGANGATFPERSAICFEAQNFPDSPNQTHFPSPVLNPGETYYQKSIYTFTVEKN
ncbi:MAG: galactose mutarotase [Bacteroidales bacterium]|nr:galactose mutarotase [Bacteroidales bacterium]